MEGDWLTVPQAARILGLASHTLSRYLKAGEIPYTVDRQRRIRVIARADLDAYLERSRLKPGDLGPTTTGAKWEPRQKRTVRS